MTLQVKPTGYDFAGYAAKYDVLCGDGRTIRSKAFEHCDGKQVPLVWQHMHDSPTNVYGYVILEHKTDGVYTYGFLNQTPNAVTAKALIQHKDIKALSIFANNLTQQRGNVMHGDILEVSLAVSGKNPGAFIDDVYVQHADGSDDELVEDALVASAWEAPEPAMAHADTTSETAALTLADIPTPPSYQEVFDTLNDLQKNLFFASVEAAVEAVTTGTATDQADQTAAHSETPEPEGESPEMARNVFNQSTTGDPAKNTITAAQWATLKADAEKLGSLKDAVLMHAVDFGIDNFEVLMPDAQALNTMPQMVKRKNQWVSPVFNGASHSPYSKIKTVTADMTMEAARARGYIKGSIKKEMYLKAAKRETSPTTIYIKGGLDRDDYLDITSFDAIVWQKSAMRILLDEEVARAMLIGDGRDAEDPDKINEEKLRPIYKEDPLYALPVRIVYTGTLTPAEKITSMIDQITRASENYLGSGSPTFFTTAKVVLDMMLLRDEFGHKIYRTKEELCLDLRVSAIVEVPLMSGLHRDSTDVVPVRLDLIGIIVDMGDYTVGADKGGQIAFFDNFDLKINKYEFLMETRISGALTMFASAMIIEIAH
jgi:hypothetical protein